MEKYKELDISFPTGEIIKKVMLDDCIKIDDEFKKNLNKKNKYPYIYSHIINGDNISDKSK